MSNLYKQAMFSSYETTCRDTRTRYTALRLAHHFEGVERSFLEIAHDVFPSFTFLKSVAISGYLVKNPSLAIRKIAFVRKYEIRDGISVPRQVQSVTDTWLVGKAELTIDYTNFSIDSRKQVVAGDTEGQ